jgi:hypothetical protein
VLLGEVHRSAEMHAFLRALVVSPEFHRVVDDVVLEATNVRFQPILDRFIAGDSVSRDSLRLVWRNSTQLLLWDSPLYEELLETIRAVNHALPAEHRLRVLASDPPIDWTNLRSASDFPRSYGYRDWQTTEIIEREVLARNRRALVIIGTTHVRRAGPKVDSLPTSPEREGVGEALARKHPGAAYSIETVVGTSELATLVCSMASPNMLLPVRSTSLETQSSSILFGRNITFFRVVDGRRVPVTIDPTRMPALRDVIDAVLYLGPYSHEVLPGAALYRSDPGYLTEIRRRISILTQVYGGDFWSEELDTILCRHP